MSATVPLSLAASRRLRLLDVLAAIGRCHDGPAKNVPVHVSSRTRRRACTSQPSRTQPSSRAPQTDRQPVPPCKHGRVEHRGLPLSRSVIMLSHNISHPPHITRPGELVTPGKQVKPPPTGPRGCLRCPFGMVNGEWWWLRRRSSTCRSRLCEGACRLETEARTCRSLALWPMPRTCGTTPSWCPRR